MKAQVLKILLVIMIVALFAGCASEGYKSDFAAYKGYSVEKIYTFAQQAMAKKDYDAAIKHFEAMDALYPFSQYAQKAQLQIIYAYYKKGDMDQVEIAADHYIRFYPQTSDADYAYYMHGLANFERSKSWLSEIYTKDPAARDVTSLKQAFDDFAKLIKLKPNSKYAEEVRGRMIFIKNALARHELQVANFYLNRKAYVAAANRANTVVAHYQDTDAVKPALEIMVKAYRAMGATKQADDAARILKLNYPEK